MHVVSVNVIYSTLTLLAAAGFISEMRLFI